MCLYFLAGGIQSKWVKHSYGHFDEFSVLDFFGIIGFCRDKKLFGCGIKLIVNPVYFSPLTIKLPPFFTNKYNPTLQTVSAKIKSDYKINLMKPKIPQQLTFNQSCSQLAISQQKTHKGNHQSLSYPVLTELIQQSILNKDFYPLECYSQDIIDILNTLKLRIDQIISNISKDVMKSRCELGLGLKSKEEISAAAEIALGQKGDLEQVRCCDVYQIFVKVSQFGESKYNGGIIQQKINTLAGNIFTQLTEYIKPIQKLIVQQQQTSSQQSQQGSKLKSTYTPPGPRQLKNSKAEKNQRQTPRTTSMKIQERKQDYSNSEQESRPTRQYADHRRRNNNGISQRVKKIAELDKTSRQMFTIRVKILRIIKKFQISGGKRVQFKAGDQTGTSTCVMNVNNLIEVGNTIEVTNCRVYLFKGKINQIQDQRNSVFTKVEGIRKIGEDYDFTDQHRRRWDNREQRRDHYNDQDHDHDHDRERERHGREIRRHRNHEFEEEGDYHKEEERKSTLWESIQPQEKKASTVSTQGVIKIQKIEPDMENISIIAQIYKIIHEQNNLVICYIGDQTGIVRAQLPSTNFVKEGNSIKITNFDAKVVSEHILVKFNKFGRVQLMSLSFPKIRLDNDISQEAWVQEEEGAEEEDDQ